MHQNFAPLNKVNIGSLVVTTEDVLNCLSKLSVKKSYGPDLVSPTILKNCASSLAVPLTLIFNSSLSAGTFPSCWKISFVSAIFKSGSRRRVDNYRGVALLPTVAKVFEKIVCKSLVGKVGGCISSLHHGFVKGRSTSTNMLLFTNFLKLNIENRQQINY